MLVHLLALGKGSGWSDRHIGRAAILLFGILVLFFVEHSVGLGQLNRLWPFTLAAALFVLRKDGLMRAFWLAELPFLLPFALALLWRGAFPDINATAEQMTDLYFISNYLEGSRLPPPDHWLPNHVFDSYYALMHYAAALIGRLLGLGAGWSMNLGFCVLTGLLGSLVWSMASQWVAKTHWRVLIVVAVLMGGSGVAPLLEVLFTGGFDAANAQTQLWAHTRFVGFFDQKITSDWGQALYHSNPALLDVPTGSRDLPLETFGYYLYIGDYHPPLGGFLLLFLALALISRLENTTQQQGRLLWVLGATVPAALAINTWVFPLQLLLVSGWVLWRYSEQRPLAVKPLIVGGLAALVLLYPFLGYFAANALSTPLRWVIASDRTPFLQWLTLWWPVLVLMLLAGWRRFYENTLESRLGAWVATASLLLLVVLEFVYIDDPLADRYNRFNTVLKWWSWLYPAVLALLAALLLGWSANPIQARVTRILTALPLLAVCSYVLPQLQYLVLEDKPSIGQFAGDAWLKRDPVKQALLRFLTVAPKGVVVEGLEGSAYTESSALALHSGQSSANGWPDHVAQWRGSPWFIQQDAADNRAFYQGKLDDPLPWLQRLNARYVVWTPQDQTRAPQALIRLRAQLAGYYDWHSLIRYEGVEYGIWVR